MTTSDNLTRLTALLQTQTAAAKSTDAEYWRLTKILRPDILDQSVIRYDEPTKVAVLGVTEPKVMANRTTGGDPTEADRRKDDIERIARGEPLVERMDIELRINHEARKRAAIEAVIENLEKQIRDEKHRLAVAHCKASKPQEVERMGRLFKAIADVHAIYSEINDTRQDLIDSGIGLHGVYLLMPDFLGNPRNRYSELGDYFRDGKRLGYINSIPKVFE